MSEDKVCSVEDNPAHLRWATSKENSADSIRHGTICRGERHGASRLTAESVRQIKSLTKESTQASIARKFGVSASTVYGVVHGLTWAYLA
jgi:hypothetical protein